MLQASNVKDRCEKVPKKHLMSGLSSYQWDKKCEGFSLHIPSWKATIRFLRSTALLRDAHGRLWQKNVFCQNKIIRRHLLQEFSIPLFTCSFPLFFQARLIRNPWQVQGMAEANEEFPSSHWRPPGASRETPLLPQRPHPKSSMTTWAKRAATPPLINHQPTKIHPGMVTNMACFIDSWQLSNPQLSNLWWMPNSVSNGFDTAMKTGSSRRFEQYPTTYRWESSQLPFTED